jgi:peptidoglycan/xylan/chitin deacetylase (PgdA/CDA1 family)
LATGIALGNITRFFICNFGYVIFQDIRIYLFSVLAMSKSPRQKTFRYCLIILAAALAMVAGVAGFNALVDPFAMYKLTPIQGFNINKPAIYSKMRLYKAFEVERVKPQTLILGSSRTHVGLRCSHEAFSHLEKPCYNLAFDGATTKEIYYYLRHAQAIRPLKHVVLGLDSYHSSPAPAYTRPDFDPLLLFSVGEPKWYHFIVADLRLLASMDTLKASIQTIRAQKQPEPDWFAADGQRLGEVFFRQVQKTFMEKGPRAYFDEIDNQEIQSQIAPAGNKKTAREEGALPFNPDESSLSYIRRIIDFCRDNNIDLRIFITPAHIHQLEITGMLWGNQAIDGNKRALVELIAQDSGRHPGKPPVPLIDFSGYSQVTTELLPPVGSRQDMRFYWDSSHFKEIVGDYVLDRLFGINNPKLPRDFGVDLNETTIDGFLKQQQKEKDSFSKQHPQEIAEIHALMPKLPIIVYHRIYDDKLENPKLLDKSTSISLSDFAGQMRYLHEQGYTTLSMPEVMDYLKGKKFPAKIVAIHFDDGWKSAKQAVPILNSYKFKASFWIIAGAGHDIGSPHMDWDAILELAKNPDFDIYSHTMTHPWKKGENLVDWVSGNTKGKGAEQASWELTESKHLLEEKLDRPVPYLAWPSGIYNDKLVKLAQDAGYTALLTIDNGLNHPQDNPFFIKRTMINGGCDMEIFKQILSDGIYRSCPAVK